MVPNQICNNNKKHYWKKMKYLVAVSKMTTNLWICDNSVDLASSHEIFLKPFACLSSSLIPTIPYMN